LIECAVGEGTTGGQAPSPWAFLVAGAAVLLRRRRASGDEKTN
jgi:MYXO-CTERM domain-containing protein